MTAPTLPPLPSLGGSSDLSDRSLRSLPPFCWCDGLLCTPWERTGPKQRLTVEQEFIVAAVAKTALGLPRAGNVTRYSLAPAPDVTVTWISASGEVICTTTVPSAWWRSRLAHYCALQIEPA